MANYLGAALLWRYIIAYIDGTDEALKPYTQGGPAGLAKFLTSEGITPQDVGDALAKTQHGDIHTVRQYVQEHPELRAWMEGGDRG